MDSPNFRLSYGQQSADLNTTFIPSLNSPLVASATKSGSTAQVFANGTSVGSATLTTNTVIATNFLIGGFNSTSSQLNGDIAEILVFPTALSTENRRRIEGYLSSKYNIAIS